MAPEWLSPSGTGCLLKVLVVPRASRTEVVGPFGDHLKVRVAAPPVDDAANEELMVFLARALGRSRSALSLLSGRSGRRKRIAVEGLPAEAVQERLAALTAIPRQR